MSTISGVSGTNITYQPVQNCNYSQWQTDFRELRQAIQSGDFTTAQQSISTIQENFQEISNNSRTGPSGQANHLLANDLGGLSQALQSGNPEAVCKAYSQLQQDFHHLRQIDYRYHHPRCVLNTEIPANGTNDYNGKSPIINITT